MFDHVVHVDIPNIDWERVQGRAIDPDILEKAVHHKSEWLLVLAARPRTPLDLTVLNIRVRLLDHTVRSA